MSAITLDYPWVLFGFGIFILFVLFDFVFPRRKQIQKNLPKHLRLKLFASRIFFRLFLVCLIIALAGPRWGIEQKTDDFRRTADVVIAMDVSRSMEAGDGRGPDRSGGRANGLSSGLGGVSRLERGLSIVSEAVTAAPGMRFGVAISRSRGIVAVPLTWDSSTVLTFLEAAAPSITGRGTNLESLVDAAADAFQSSYPSTKVIVLVSDGEALSGSLKAALMRCKRNGIIVASVAMGSDEGAALPASVPGGEGVVSYRDLSTMRMAAGQTGGIFIDGNREDAATMLASYLRSLAPGSEIRENQAESKARWLIFVMLAIMMFGASKLSMLNLRREK